MDSLLGVLFGEEEQFYALTTWIETRSKGSGSSSELERLLAESQGLPGLSALFH